MGQHRCIRLAELVARFQPGHHLPDTVGPDRPASCASGRMPSDLTQEPRGPRRPSPIHAPTVAPGPAETRRNGSGYQPRPGHLAAAPDLSDRTASRRNAPVQGLRSGPSDAARRSGHLRYRGRPRRRLRPELPGPPTMPPRSCPDRIAPNSGTLDVLISRPRSRSQVPAGIRRSSGARWLRLCSTEADPLRRLRLSSMTVAAR